ncbi:MAG TPA: Ig-like domain-containing protein [Patescibacteria group bacterium]|nr:Ig-like domain-containing protein [Patescibacteria group bacterium]
MNLAEGFFPKVPWSKLPRPIRKKLVVGLITIAVGILAITGITFNYLNQQSTENRIQAENPAQQIQENTKQLLALNRAYQLAPKEQAQEALNNVIVKAVLRQLSLADAIKTNPQAVLLVAFDEKKKAEFSQEVQRSLEENVTLTGEMEVEIEEYADSEGNFTQAKENHRLKAGQDTIELYFVNQPEGLVSGDQVTVTGVKVKNRMAVPAGGLKLEQGASQLVLGAVTTKRMAVIVFNFQNDTSRPHSISTIRQWLFTNSNSSINFFPEDSYNLLGFAELDSVNGDVFGYYTIPYNSAEGCPSRDWANAARNAATADGHNLANYNHFVYMFPATSTCPWAGGAELVGDEVLVKLFPKIESQSLADLERSHRNVTIHELGHNLGLHHAAGYNCTDTAGQKVAISPNCTLTEYGDPFDRMGHGVTLVHFNNRSKDRLGWLTDVDFKTITTSGSYTLAPLYGAGKPKGLRLVHTKDSSGNPASYYYLEFRQPYGLFDTWTTSLASQGVTIRDSGNLTQRKTFLVDTKPGTATSYAEFNDAPLLVGQTFSDPAAAIAITTTAIAASGATVNITLPKTPVCTRAKPGISISPTSQYGQSGASLSYSLTVTNYDSLDCGSSAFAVTATLPNNWSQNPASLNLSLAPGQTATQTIAITSPANAADGFYTFTETASNTAAAAYFAQVQAGYNIDNPPPPPSPSPSPAPSPLPSSSPNSSPDPTPSASGGPSTTTKQIVITDPRNNSRIKVGTTMTISASVAGSSANKVEFKIDGTLVCTDTETPYSCAWQIPEKVNTKYSITAIAAYPDGGNAEDSIRITGSR